MMMFAFNVTQNVKIVLLILKIVLNVIQTNLENYKKINVFVKMGILNIKTKIFVNNVISTVLNVFIRANNA